MTTRQSTIHEAASQLLDTLRAGRTVTLEITTADASAEALLGLITEIHELATAQRVGIQLTPMGEDGLWLTLAAP